MTVSASSTVQTATGNGSQTSFSYSFKNYQSSDLDVYVNKILQTSGYTVTINSDFNGGNVVFSVAPTNGHAIKILRKQDLSQSFDPQIYQSINELDLESTFDKVVMQIQELQEQADRSSRVPPYVNGFNAVYPEPVASKIPRFNAAANAWELVDSATIVTEGGGGGGSGGGGSLNTIGITVPTDVLSVSPSSLSADGTFAISKVSQSQNTVAAGPTSGSGAWTFRALVAGDIPNLDVAKITTGAFAKARQHASTVYIDQSNTYTGANVQNFGDSTQTLVLPLKSTPGSPTTGEIYVDAGNLKFRDAAGPTNKTVITDTFQINTTSPLTGGGALTSNLTIALGTVPIANGGLGSTTWSAGDIAVMNNAGTAFTRLPLGANGRILSVNTGLSPQLEWIAGGSGVTSVAMTLPTSLFTSPPSGSPITSSGTFAVALANQTGNVVFSSPSGGGSGAPTFRSLVIADLPTITTAKGGTNLTTYTTGDLIYASASNVLSKLPIGTSGQLLAVSAGGVVEWITASGTGTVTSVAMTLPSALFTTPPTGSPITTSGTFAVALASQTQNLVFSSPDGSSGTPTFRALVAADIPNLAASKITSGTFAEARGGTNQSTYTTGDFLYASGANTLSKRAIGTTGQALLVSSGAPAWGTLGVAGGGTSFTTYATGDLLYASTTNTLAKLAAGTNGHVLTLASGVPSWAAASGGGTASIMKVKAASQTKNTDAVIADDDTLVFAVGASETWAFRITFFYTQGNNSGNLDVTMAGPAGCTIAFNVTNTQIPLSSIGNAGSAEVLIDGTTGVTYTVEITGTIINSTTPGNCAFRWAQNAAHASNLVVLGGSTLIAVKS